MKLMGRVMVIGLWISLGVTLIGAILFLLNHGEEPLSFKGNALSLKVIESGIILLILLQVVRVGLVAWYFFELKEKRFGYCSLFLFLVLIVALVV